MANTGNRKVGQNVSSRLLSQAENDQLFNILGRKCSSLATSVVQLFLAASQNSWTKKLCGVVCFVKDTNCRSYYIRIFDIVRGAMLWEQELFNQFKYHINKSFFHTFQTDNCWAGLNFANDAEARDFSSAIISKIQAKQQRREDKKRRAPAAPNRPNAAPPLPGPNQRRRSAAAIPPSLSDTRLQNKGHSGTGKQHQRRFSSSDSPSPSHALSKVQPPSPTVETTKKKDKKKDKGKKVRLTKADIGRPSEFRHVSHVGWDPEKGFDVDEMDPDIKAWFKKNGVSENDLQDHSTAQFIKTFVDDHGGFDAIKDEAEKNRILPSLPPPTPSRGSAPYPPPPAGNYGPPPPLPPSRGPAPPPPFSSKAAPPPPPSRSLPPTPPSMAPPSFQSRPAPAPAPPPPPAVGGPPPPPPPPPPALGATPPPPPPPVAGGGGGGGGGGNKSGRGGLLNDIHKGIALKRVDPTDRPAAPSSGRGALLDEIRGGKALKKVDMDRESEVAPSVPQDGLGAALFNALQARSNAIHSEDSDDDSDDDDDFDDEDEWE